MKKGTPEDPKGLISEAYKIEGITAEECRTIFLDWALSVPVDADSRDLIGLLLERHGLEGHPMTQVMRDGLETMQKPRRRGGLSRRPAQ